VALGLLLIAALTTPLEAQVSVPTVPVPVPADFQVHAEAGSVDPDGDLAILDLAADGTGTLCIVLPVDRETGDCSTVTSVTFTADEVTAVWDAVRAGNFFNLAPSHIGNAVDGSFAELTVTASGSTHTVLTQNLALAPFDAIMLALNAPLPAGSKLYYNEILDQL
jgi:hypothetical protein